MIGTTLTLLFLLGGSPAAGHVGHVELGPSIHLAPWRWISEEGRERAFSDWKGHTLVVAPFFTTCQVRCPQTLSKLFAIADAYRKKERGAIFILVTLDPEHDTPTELRRFKERAHLPAGWQLLSGSRDDTRALNRLLDTRPAYDDEHIDHQVRIGVFDGAGHLVRNLHGWGFDVADAVLD